MSTATEALVTYGPQAVLAILGIVIAHTLSSLRSSIDALRSEDKALHRRIDEKSNELASRLQYVEQNFVTRPEIAAGQRDMRQDIQGMETKILDQLRLIHQDIAILNRTKADKNSGISV
jgi:cell division protein ZapA (FtsZ GTPase activity inhibitor)